MSKRLGGIIGCKCKTSSWHLNGFPYGSNIGSTVYIGEKPTVILTLTLIVMHVTRYFAKFMFFLVYFSLLNLYLEIKSADHVYHGFHV